MVDSPPLITLTTDFGLRDAYVAAMKGVLASRCPHARIIDLGHNIPPQDVLAAAMFLDACVPYYPEGTTHVIVVDPGVGTDRHPIVLRAGGHTFICPDNGVLTLVLRRWPVEAAHRIENPAFKRDQISATFHGRDVFAPAAAALACGEPIEAAGPELEQLIELSMPVPNAYDRRIAGTIMYVDHFGNCITNIERSHVPQGAEARVHVGEQTLQPIFNTYGEVAPGQLLALASSTGHVELAVREGSAAERLGLRIGDIVEVAW